MFREFSVSCVGAIFLVILAPASFGALSTETYKYVTNATSYSAAQGATVSVLLFLQEQVTSGSNSLLAGDSGLNSAGAAVNRTSGTSSPAIIAGFTADTTDFNGPSNNTSLPASSMNFGEGNSSTTSGPMGTQVSAGLRQQYLGTLTIQTGAAGDISTFSLVKHPGNFNTTTEINDYDLEANGTSQTAHDGNTYSWDGVGATVSTFTVTATPEPTAAALLALAAGPLLLRWRFRRVAGSARSPAACNHLFAQK
jgi:hypothetical protein